MPVPPPGTFSFQATLTNMSDVQLTQTINQLSNAAAQSYSAFRPATNSPMATFEPKQWTAAPNASKSSVTRVRNRPSRAATSTPVQNANAAVHQQQQHHQSYVPQAQPATAAAAPTPRAYVPPRPPLPTRPQALQTTYPSRLRTGVTLLMQPILASSSSAAGTGRVGTRRGGVINYAEPGSGDELDAGALDSDDSDFVASGGTRSAIRATRSSRVPGGGPFQHYQFASHHGSPAPYGKQQDVDQSYLGMIPPAKYIVPKRVDPTKHIYPSQEALENQALKPSALVPVRVEFETDTHRIRDCFIWDLNDDLTKPDTFARIFCADLDLPLNPWVETITNQIRAQLEEHEGVATMDLGSSLEGYVSEEESEGQEVPECRVILSIDVQIATYHLLDHIEWDLLSPLTPEAFAKTLCMDLGLTGEAAPLIAHAIHEEIIKHKKDAIEWGVIGGDTRDVVEDSSAAAASNAPTGDREKRDKSGLSLHKDKTGLGLGPGTWGRAPRDGLGRGPRALKSVWKEWTESEEYSTRFEVLTAEEVERREIERERASRRLRRETSKFQFSSTRRRR